MDGVPGHISVAVPMRMVQVTWVRSSAHGHVIPAVLDHIHQLRVAGFTVMAIHSDGEGTVMKLVTGGIRQWWEKYIGV